MKQVKEKYQVSPHTGMKYMVSEELGKKKKPMFPEKLARITELIKKADLSILNKSDIRR